MKSATQITAASLASLALIPAAATTLRAGEVETGWQVDETGRTFKTAFDPGNRVIMGTGLLVEGSRDGADARAAIAGGVCFMQTISSGMKHDVVLWQLEHRVLDAVVDPAGNGPGGWPAMDVSLYRGTFLRHADNATVTFPSDPPRQIYFPLDVGAEAGIGRVETKPRAPGARNDVRVGVARAAVLLDPWRPGRPGNALEIGIGARYDLDIAPGKNGGPADTVHRVAPFTAAGIRWRLQDSAGLTLFHARADSVPYWRSYGDFSFLGEVSTGFERVLLAFDDQPLSLLVDAAARTDSAKSGGAIEYKALLGLAFGFQR